jgi:hypothetical protein
MSEMPCLATCACAGKVRSRDWLYLCLGQPESEPGLLVVETSPLSLGTSDDIWFHCVTDSGLPGPDLEGVRYLLVPPRL